MRILVLSPRPPWSLGGVEKVVKETTTRLMKNKDITLEVWCKGYRNETVFWNEIKVRIFNSIFGFSPALVNKLKRLQKQFDIIHIHGTSNLYPLEALMAIENWNKVIVSSHYHPQGSTLLFRLIKPIYDKFIVSRYLRKANKIICVSNTEKNILSDNFKLSRDKLRVIYNGVDVQRINSFKSRRKKEKGKVSILYFGRLERYKNVYIAIEALKYLPDTFVIYIVGKGPYENELIRLVKKLGLEDRVKFLGFLSEEELYALLHSVDIVINLSEIEAFGIMVVESLAAGKPVIVNNKGGLRELARYFPESVILIENPTPKKVARVIRVLVTKRKIKVKRLNNFEWMKIAKLYYDIYKSESRKQGEMVCESQRHQKK